MCKKLKKMYNFNRESYKFLIISNFDYKFLFIKNLLFKN